MDKQAMTAITKSIDNGLVKNLENISLAQLSLSMEARIRTINRIIEKEFTILSNDSSKRKIDYLVLNIVHLEKRIEDITWLLNKKREFKCSDKIMFKFVLLKDKINEP